MPGSHDEGQKVPRTQIKEKMQFNPMYGARPANVTKGVFCVWNREGDVTPGGNNNPLDFKISGSRGIVTL